MTMDLLRLDNVSAAYGDKVVLHGVSLSVGSGKVVALIGPNGAGKTTLIKAACGLLPYRGGIHYGDAELGILNARERAALRAYVPQLSDTTFPYRVCDWVAMGLAFKSRFYGTPRASERVTKALADVGFAASPEVGFDELSGGERQQAMIARALVQGAPLILMDEPTSGLDLKHRARAIAAIRKRVRVGGAALLSMHDLNLAAAACDEVILLNHGRIVAGGPPSDVLQSELLAEVYEVKVACGQHPKVAVPTVEIDPEAWS